MLRPTICLSLFLVSSYKILSILEKSLQIFFFLCNSVFFTKPHFFLDLESKQMSKESGSDEEFVERTMTEHEIFKARADTEAKVLRGRRFDRLHSDTLSAKMEDRKVQHINIGESQDGGAFT